MFFVKGFFEKIAGGGIRGFPPGEIHFSTGWGMTEGSEPGRKMQGSRQIEAEKQPNPLQNAGTARKPGKKARRRRRNYRKITKKYQRGVDKVPGGV